MGKTPFKPGRIPTIGLGKKFGVAVRKAQESGFLYESLRRFITTDLTHREEKARIWVGHQLFVWILPLLPLDKQQQIVRCYEEVFKGVLPESVSRRRKIWRDSGTQPAELSPRRQHPEISKPRPSEELVLRQILGQARARRATK